MASKTRLEHDSLGDLQVPAEALYGAQTQRAVQNFPISGLRMPHDFIRALGLVKAAAAGVNAGLGHLPKGTAAAIRSAALQVAAGDLDGQFPVDVFQTGSGTSSNMNANEVIASLASSGAKNPCTPTTRSTWARVPTTSSRPRSRSRPCWPAANACCRR